MTPPKITVDFDVYKMAIFINILLDLRGQLSGWCENQGSDDPSLCCGSLGEQLKDGQGKPCSFSRTRLGGS